MLAIFYLMIIVAIMLVWIVWTALFLYIAMVALLSGKDIYGNKCINKNKVVLRAVLLSGPTGWILFVFLLTACKFTSWVNSPMKKR